VTGWVEKFNSAPLNEMFYGIIDLDEGNASAPRIDVIGRYSIQNYQLDPMVIFGLLIDERKAPAIPDVVTTPGDEHHLRTLPDSVLQRVVDYVAEKVEPALGALTVHEIERAAVTFTSGARLEYPRWMLAKRGHDLLPIYQRIFGHSIVTPPKLEKSFRRVRLVPIELAEIMAGLQKT
jgi:hypothetical protein